MRGLLIFILGVAVLTWGHHTEPAKYRISPSLLRVLAKIRIGYSIFSSNLYKCLSKQTQGDLVLSPQSAYLSLALVLAGAKGRTHSEIRKALNCNLNSTESNKLGIALSRELNNQLGSFNALAASGMFVDNDFPICEEFKGIAENIYRTKVQTVDFAKVKQALSAINSWVKARHPEIEKILEPNQISKTTKLVLANAVRISAKWKIPFLTKDTKKGAFHVSAGKTKNVNYMRCCRQALYGYDHVLCAKFLELPFASINQSLVIVLPNKKNGLAELEAKFDKVLAFEDFEYEQVNISLPRFRFRTLKHLKPALQKLGIKRIFNPKYADLTGISKKKGLFVNNLVQEGCISVCEAGLEAGAAGATPVSKAVISTAKQYSELTFNADHPFLFYVKAARRTPVLIGRVVIPETAKSVVDHRYIEEEEDDDDENDKDDNENDDE